MHSRGHLGAERRSPECLKEVGKEEIFHPSKDDEINKLLQRVLHEEMFSDSSLMFKIKSN